MIARVETPATATPPQQTDREAALREQAPCLHEPEGRLDGHTMRHGLQAAAHDTQDLASKT